MSFNFIGRKEEIQRFRESVESLRKGHLPNIQVFLIGGEGGFGKTTLLRRYEEIIRAEYSPKLLCIYLDCEQTDLRSQDGTLPLMRMLVDLLKKADPEFQADCFEQAWSRRLDSGDRHQHQVECSKSFVADLASLSSRKPLVILLDTWERVESFASEWLRRGFLRHSLKAQACAVFVIAGRLSEEFVLNTRDALIEFSTFIHDRALSRFTRSETEEFLATTDINVNIEDVYRLTRGIPLALSILKEMVVRFQESGIEGPGPSSADLDKGIIQALVTRFFRHLENCSGFEASLYRKSFYTLAMVSTIRCDGSVRAHLLQKWWEQTVLHGYGFSEWAARLRREFSFVQSSLTLHPDVAEVVVRFLKGEQEGSGRRRDKERNPDAVILAQQAIAICKSMRTPEKVSNWDLLHLNFLFWAQEYRQGLQEALNLVSYASSIFRDDLYELLSKWEEDVAEHGFKWDISSLLDVIDKWGNQEAMDRYQEVAARYQIDPQGRIRVLLDQARKAAQKGNYDNAVRAIEQAARHIGATSPSPFEEWALEIHSIVQNLLNIKDRQAWLSALRIVQEGHRLVDNDPWLLLAEARVLSQLKMFPQALARLWSASLNRSLVSQAKQLSFNTIWDDLDHTIRQQVAKMPQRGRKGAKILTNLGDLSSAYGDFREAEQYYQRALERDPFYIPAAIKRANLLRQMGQLQEASYRLEESEQRMKTIEARNVVALKLLTRWRAGLKECWGSLYATKGILEGCRDDLRESIRYFREAKRLSPEYANPYIGEAWVYLLLGEGEEAYSLLESARRILEREEKGPLYQVYNGMGIAALLCGKRGERFFTVALTLCERTREEKITRPYQVIAHHGIASLGLRNFDQASEGFRQLKEFREAKGWWATLKEEVQMLCDLLPEEYQQQAGAVLATLL